MENTKKILAITVDGCTVPNPGKMRVAAIYELVNSLEEYLEGHGKVIGVTTKYIGWGSNNVCEYQAIIIALKRLRDLDVFKDIKGTYSRVVVVSDSKLAVNQILGAYKTNSKRLRTEREVVRILISELEDFKIVWQPRTNPRLVEVDILSKGGDAAEALADKLIAGGARTNE